MQMQPTRKLAADFGRFACRKSPLVVKNPVLPIFFIRIFIRDSNNSTDLLKK